MTGLTTPRFLTALALFALVGCTDRTPRRDGPPPAEASGLPARADTAAGDSLAAAEELSDQVSEPVGPPAPLSRAPEQIRGIYLNAYAAGSRSRLPRLMEIADSTEINTFVIDVKTERGIHYTSEVPLARELQQDGENMLRDMSTTVSALHERGIYAIARIVIFKDPILSKAKPEWSIRNPDGGLWVDKAGNTWVSAWNRDVWDYNLDIAEEAARAGFD